MSDVFPTAFLASCLALAILLTICCAVVFFVMSRTNKKQQKKFVAVQQTLQVGQKVTIIGGIYGEIAAIRKDTCDIKVKSGAVLEVDRSMVQAQRTDAHVKHA